MSGRRRRSDFVVAIFVAILWAAVSFAVDGIISLSTARDPITAEVSPFYAIIALLLAMIVTWFCVGVALGAESPWLSALVAMALVYLVLVGSAAPLGLELVGDQAASPFVIVAAVLAGLTVVLAWRFLRNAWPSTPR